MKKVLFATTALVFSAGFAAAEVSLSGDGRMGVVYNGDDWNFSSRARVIFTLSGQTDGGLEFGGSFKAHESGAAENGSAGSVYVSGAFGKLEMGDVVSAPEALFGDLPEVGYEDLTAGEGDYTGFASLNGQGLLENDIPYLTGDSGATTSAYNPVLLYTYSAGAFSVAASLSDGKEATGSNAYNVALDSDQEYAIAAAYTFQNYTVGLGYEVLDFKSGTTVFGHDKATQLELAGVATFGDTSVKAYYAAGDDGNPVDQAYGLGVSSVFGATTVMGYVQKVDFTDDATAALDLDGATWWGLGASYDLGGGASVAGGISDSDLDGSNVTADLGVKFKF
ncbi:porin [Sinirhodobacter huangdaonensis]|uniref:Porin n=1 Tax=Paenirhodobacter huangdaonensis TaxID=2501515 RepID=A0A3S3MA60_9RHOB|nr:porin [Sinirhodobacter huangdaonensis]RWR52789.1 porin [Sinirhodobacter huangdaonensis]